MMDLPEALKRIEELEKEREGYRSSLVSMWNNSRDYHCSFCDGTGLCSSVKSQLRWRLLAEWKKPITWEEHINWCQNRAADHEEWMRQHEQKTTDPDNRTNG
jgi:hypothetical protein